MNASKAVGNDALYKLKLQMMTAGLAYHSLPLHTFAVLQVLFCCLLCRRTLRPAKVFIGLTAESLYHAGVILYWRQRWLLARAFLPSISWAMPSWLRSMRHLLMRFQAGILFPAPGHIPGLTALATQECLHDFIRLPRRLQFDLQRRHCNTLTACLAATAVQHLDAMPVALHDHYCHV